MKNIYSLILTFLLSLSVLQADHINISKACDNQVRLQSSANSSFAFEITTSKSFEGTLYQIVEGKYVKVETKTGSGNTILTFLNVQSETTYKLLVVFDVDENEKLCKTRQVSGLKL